MVQFKVGDNVNICAYVRDWCGTYSLYYIYDINIAVDTCQLVTYPPSCIPDLSGVLVEFQWTNSRSSSDYRNCTDGSKTRLLGSGYTNSQGIVSISHTIDQTDLDIYNINPTYFDLRSCIKNKSSNEVIYFGYIRSNITRHYGDDIQIVANLCSGVTCQNQCFGYDLWSTTCDPATGLCVQNSLVEVNSPTCGYIPPGINQYKLYFKVADIYPTWYVESVLGTLKNVAIDNLKMLTSYYVDTVTFNADTRIVTITINSYQGLTLVMGSDGRIYTMIAPLIIAAFWVLYIAACILVIGASLFMQFFSKEETVAGQAPSTRAITVNAQICTSNATTGEITCAAISDPNITVEVKMTAGDKTETKEITTTTPSVTFSAPTNVDIGIVGSVKDNTNYTLYEATDESLKACVSGGQCPTTIPITIKLQSKADGTTSPKVADTAGNPATGQYTLFIKTSAGHMVEDGSGSLEADGSVPKTRIPSDQEYCILVIPADYPTHTKVWKCTTLSAGEESKPDLTVLSCIEEKNKVSIRTVYIGTTGAQMVFIPDKIEIKEGTPPTIVKTRTKDDPVEANRTEEVTIIDGLEKTKTYTVHITSSYTIKPAYQDQQVTFATDCNTTTLITVEAEAPANTYEITIEVKNSITQTPLQGATVTLGSLTDHVTGPSGLTLFTAVPSGTHDLKVALAGYKPCTGTTTCPKIVDVTSSRTVSVLLEVDQVLSNVDTRISNFGTVGDIIATKPVKFKGDLEYLEGTTYHPLTDAQISVVVKDQSDTTIQTLDVVTQKGILGIGSGHFETGEWLVPESFTNTQISVTTTFAGVGQYKSSTITKTYVAAAADACVIPLPWGGCLLSKEAGTGLLLIGGLIVGGIIIFSMAGPMISKKMISGSGSTTSKG